MRRLLLAAAAALLPAVLHAQAPQYRRAPGDTLRYREVTSAVHQIPEPRGKISVRSHHDARIVLTFAAGDTVRAWYEALVLRTTHPGGERLPPTEPLLGERFVLTLGARGDVAILSVPHFPAEVAETTDLTQQFDDFFVRLPSIPLRANAEWADTTRDETSSADGGRRTLRVGSYRVRGDTMVGGTPAVVIETRVRNRLESTELNPPLGMTIKTVMEGVEVGTMVFAPTTGRMIRRARTATLSGHIEYVGGPKPIRRPQTMTYESTIELLP